MDNSTIIEKMLHVQEALKKNDFKGNDPYQLDQLAFTSVKSSPFLKSIRKLLKPFHSLIPRQLFQNLPKIEFPTVLAQILQSNIIMSHVFKDERFTINNDFIFNRLISLSLSKEYLVFGLPFEWGGEVRYPKNTPFTINQMYIAEAFIDAYKYTNDLKYLNAAKSTLDYVIKKVRIEDISDNETIISYSEMDTIIAYNVISFSAYVFQYYNVMSHENILPQYQIENMLTYVNKFQTDSGAWEYGQNEGKNLEVIDNRHTSYMINAFHKLLKLNPSLEPVLSKSLAKGVHFYNEFLLDGILPRWSETQTYPLDISDLAMAIVNLTHLDKNKAKELIEFIFEHMYDEKGYFYFKLNEGFKKNKSHFIRWGDGWMLYALAKYYESEI